MASAFDGDERISRNSGGQMLDFFRRFERLEAVSTQRLSVKNFKEALCGLELVGEGRRQI